MTTSRGVLTIVHSQPKYARHAVNLARSIRLRDPHLSLAVATDLDAALFEGMYDVVIPWKFDHSAGFLYKLEIAAMSPFDTTVYLDTDMLVFGSLQPVFEIFESDAFGVFGRNDPAPSYFEDMNLIRAALPAPTYPKFNGGLYYCEKGESIESLLRAARAWHVCYDALRIKYDRGMESDEALLSLAMVQAGMRARQTQIDGVYYNPIWPDGCAVETDVIGGVCEQVTNAGRERRAVLHYYGGAMLSYGYEREALRLESAFHNPEHHVRRDWLIRARALLAWASMPKRWRWRVRRFIKKFVGRSNE
ncbi:MAG: hypothetical protein NTZ50_10585 [Chloroflexi bacterium]|nr:hypothetical protein [Chloroflexota bacterium]